MIQEYDFNISKVKNGECLFPKKISNNLWIVYHGTSSLSEDSIEQNGLNRNQSNYSKYDIQKIIDIYEKIDWTGIDQGGFMVLKSFTMNYDFKDSNKKSIFLAESSNRALLYATNDFAGGETARAIRKSIYDLQRYSKENSIRSNHMLYRIKEYKQSLNHLHSLPKPQEIDLDCLNRDIENVSEVFQRTENLYNTYKYGLIYAVKLSKNDVKDITYNNMGIVVNKNLNFNTLVGKIKVPKEYIYRRYNDRKKLEVMLNPKDLYLELQKANKFI